MPLKFWLNVWVQFPITVLSSATILPVPLNVPFQPLISGSKASRDAVILDSSENDHVSLAPPPLVLPDPEPLTVTVPIQDLVAIKSLAVPCPKQQAGHSSSPANSPGLRLPITLRLASHKRGKGRRNPSTPVRDSASIVERTAGPRRWSTAHIRFERRAQAR